MGVGPQSLALCRGRRRKAARRVALVSAAGVPCGAVRSVGEVCSAAQLATRGMILEAAHPRAGLTRSIASPARFGAAPPPAPRPAPMLREHQAEVLRDWLAEAESSNPHMPPQQEATLDSRSR